MRIYTKIEIAQIFGQCKSEEEVYEACARFRYLILNADQKHFLFMETISLKRITYLIKNQKDG